MSKLAAMPFFPAEFFADTAHMTPDAAKAYLYLLGHAWLRGARLPNHDPELARMARLSPRGWQRVCDSVMAMWTLDEDGFYRQKRLSKEYVYVLQKATQNRENGKRGGRPKLLKTHEREKADGFRTKSETNPPTPTPTQVSIQKPSSIKAVDELFTRFWTIYPKRGGSNPRKPAFDKFAGCFKRGVDPEAIIAGAEAYAHQCEALGKIGTEHVAHAVTWLNQERWADDHAVPSGHDPPNGKGRSGGMMGEIKRRLNDDDGCRESEDQGDWGSVHPRSLPAPGTGGH